jgi:hypothetical protein
MHRIRLNSLSWNEGKSHTLSECSNQELSLHQSKVVANADKGTGSKGDVGMARNLSLAFGGEAVRIERLWIRKVLRSAL